ncbi:membrane protein [Haloquadratum phage sp.]|nr:membrane protein [Haloquadratum phage sp.]
MKLEQPTIKAVLIAVFASMLGIANIAATKVVTIATVSTTAGVLPIAIAYLISDIGVERYGKQFGHTLVWSGIASLIGVIGVSQLVIALPGSSAVNDVLGASMPILLASISAILVAQHGDIALFVAIRDKLPYRPTRNIGSTVVSQLLDTSMFSLLAFFLFPQVIGGQVLALGLIASIIITEWVIKVIIAIIDTPLFIAATEQ